MVQPDSSVHRWSLHYDPRAAEGRGMITLSFDDRVHQLKLDEQARDEGASFDRFGLFNVQSGGHHVKVFIDDVRYSK